MPKCELCLYGRNNRILDRQIRGNKSKIFLDNWECAYPNEQVRKIAKPKGWPETCQEYRPK